MSRSLEDLAPENKMEAENRGLDAKEQAMKDKPKTYRITVETIGPEVDPMNNGAPRIIETDGFFIIGISKNDAGMGIDIAAHHVSPMDIAKGVIDCSKGKEIQEAMMLERMRRMFKAAGV